MEPTHTPIADHFVAFAAFVNSVAWLMGWLPGVASLVMTCVAICYYLIQITSSAWWKRRKQRLHRARLRRARKTS